MDLYRRFFPEASESEVKAFVETYGLVETMAEFQGLLLGVEEESWEWGIPALQ
jgi:hypothetical protein